MKYILASKSPRRQELMKNISSCFDIEVHSIDENKYYVLGPEEAVKKISYEKGLFVSKAHKKDIVISADTIVVLNDKIIGKPVDINDAVKILKMLSNKTHKVITGYTIFYNGQSITNTVITDVEFNELNDQLILDYVSTKSPLDKAGAYGIQDNDKFPIVKKIIGSHDNVVGFPINEIKEDINRLIDIQN